MRNIPAIRKRVLDLIVLVVASTVTAAQSTIYQLPGGAAGERYGAAVKAIADVDGDSVPDILVGAPGGYSALGFARVVSGVNGTDVRLFVGSTAGGEFGAALCAGDLNLDGRADPVIGAPLAGAQAAGTVTAFDGLSGQPLWALSGNGANDHFGFAVAALGDVSGDLLHDFAICAVDDDDQGASSGTVRVVSGHDGATLYQLEGLSAGELFGYALCALPDLDGDGASELAIGTPRIVGASNTAPGSVRVVSGASGVTLFTSLGKSGNDAFGRALAALGDIDGDLVPDLLVGAPQPSGGQPGYARLLSGAGGGLLLEVAASGAADQLGASVAAAGDVDADGTPDLAVGAPRNDDAGNDSGSVLLFSGKTGSPLAQLTGKAAGYRLGAALDGGFDPNQDGVIDIVAGSEGDSTAGASSGSARVLSTRTLALSSDLHLISVAAPASQVLSLDAGPSHAGDTYLLLGSISGTQPGTTFGGQTLSLNPDRYFAITLQQLPAGPLVAPSGSLDGSGRASAAFTLPPSAPLGLLVGLTFQHAFVLIDPGGAASLASNPVPVTLTL